MNMPVQNIFVKTVQNNSKIHNIDYLAANRESTEKPHRFRVR